jgi:hypothetical protein
MSAITEIDTLMQGRGEAARIVIGCTFISAGAVVLLPIPAVREACGQALGHAGFRKLLNEVAALGYDRVFESLGQGGTPPA